MPAHWAPRIVIATVLLLVVQSAQAQPSDVAAVVAGNNRFALDMYHALRTSDAVAADHGNLIFSPYSISTAVGMVYAGARGRTADEIADVFHFGLPPDRLHPAYGELIRDLNGPHRADYQLSIANRLWGQDGFPFRQPFLNTTRDHYGGELGRLDFASDAEGARQTINRWVEDQTNDRIKDLIPAGALQPDTRLVLTNAIYFLGDWKRSFDASLTADRPFVASAAEQIRAPTMYQNGYYRYADGGDFQMLELPYEGDQLSMLVVLPKAGGSANGSAFGGELSTIGNDVTTLFDGTQVNLLRDGITPLGEPPAFHPIPLSQLAAGPVGLDALAALEATLTPELLQDAIGRLASKRVNVYLPKFTLNTGVTLKETLSDMGMPTAFSDFADFDGISEIALKIDQVRHKAFIQLDEKGTEAAAATSIEMVMTTAIHMDDPIFFNADHPFLFLIRDNLTDSTLFMGRLGRPEGSVVAVPEPSSIPLFAAAIVCLTIHRMRRRNRR